MDGAARLPAYRAARRLRWARHIGNVAANLALWLGALVCIAPLLILVVDSIHSPFSGRFQRPAIVNYLFILQSPQLWVAFKNTAVQEAIILITTLFFCPLAGYGFAKFAFRGKGFLFGVMMLTLFFAPITLLIPLLLEMNEIGWINTYQGLVMPLVISAAGIFWMTMVIRGVPDELLHAARLDGCGSFSTWWRIVLPVIKPSLLALAFFTFMTAYNDYLWPLLILLDPSMQTIQIFLQNGGGGYGGASPATAVVVALPGVIVFLIMQRFFLPELFRQGEIPVPDEEDEDRFQPAAPAAAPAVSAPSGAVVWDVPPAPAWDASPRGRARAVAAALPGLRPWPAARTGRLVHCALIAMCTLAVYLNALHNGVLLDDVYRVVENAGIEQVMPIWRHFTDPLTSSGLPGQAQYRPLLPLSLSINYALTGNSAIGYRLGNVLLVVAAGLVVYFLARELLGSWSATSIATVPRRRPRDSGRVARTAHEAKGQGWRRGSLAVSLPGRWRTGSLAPHRVEFLAMIVALLVSVHPVSGLLVSYISGRALLLMQFFLGASLLCYARMRRLRFAPERTRSGDAPALRRLLCRWFGSAPLEWALALALFELALLAKAQAIVAPALILAFELTAGRGRLHRLTPLARALPFALVAAGHFAFMNTFLHFSALPDAPSIGFDATWTYPLTQLRLSVVHYLANFAWPFGMRAVTVEPTVTSLQDPGVIVGIVFLVGTLTCAWLLRRANPLLAFCIFAYWIAQSPESSITPMLHNAADYRPYPASPFLFLAVAWLLERALKPALSSALLVALALFFAAATVHMNVLW